MVELFGLWAVGHGRFKYNKTIATGHTGTTHFLHKAHLDCDGENAKRAVSEECGAALRIAVGLRCMAYRPTEEKKTLLEFYGYTGVEGLTRR
jgi:hypothetical protein